MAELDRKELIHLLNASKTPKLAGLNLEGLDLSGMDLSNADLRRCNLKDCRFDRTDLSRADLRDADYDPDALAKATSTRGAKLSGVKPAAAAAAAGTAGRGPEQTPENHSLLAKYISSRYRGPAART